MATNEPFDIWFLDRVNTLVKRYQGENAALFFLGLSGRQAKLLASCSSAVPDLARLLDGEGHLDYSSLTESKGGSFRSLIAANEPHVLLYEQLGLIKGSLEELYDGRIVVVRNNLFLDSEGYPCPASQDEMEKLSAYLEGGSQDGPASAKCYGQVSAVGSHFLVMPIRYEDELGPEVVDLVEGVDDIYCGNAICDPVKVPGPQYLAARLDAAHGIISNMSFDLGTSTVEGLGANGATLLQLAGMLLDSGADCVVCQQDANAAEPDGSERLLPLLRQYWGNRATFRPFRFYKDPNKDNEMAEVSQGVICDYVVTQAELALAGSENFSNTLVTAPTGAGKSLLFQLAALYLAKEHGVVTIVIEPLKALMRDQVQNLRSRGVYSVAAINSDISFDERNYELARVRRGEVSLIYLSPELLLASSIDGILGGRRLGLVVVDEVHTVTSWGKDFRPDYWYLGSYLTKLRKSGMLFPLFCLTATAVYGGKDDMVFQTVKDLELGDCKLFLGNPRREDLDFAIRQRNKANFSGPIDEVKFDLAVKWIDEAIARGGKSIVYCPYRSHVDSIMDALDRANGKVLGYHGGKDKEYREIVTSAFKRGSCRALVSTKAFGMGVDISDITDVYHYAPTGNLSDYVQEIGRAARDGAIQGTASIDFFRSDTSYARRLYAMSSFRQWQLREIMGKLYSIYASKPQGKRHQNMLVSPDTFSYLFPNEKDETGKANKVKAALMMISQDLIKKYNFPVLVARPNPTYTTAYICISTEAEGWFLSEYGTYVERLSDARTRYEAAPNQNTVKVRDLGGIYRLQADKMWEERFSNLTFGQFKRSLFNGELGPSNVATGISPRLILNITYVDDRSVIESRFDAYIEALRSALLALSREGEFKEKDFEEAFKRRLGSSAPAVKNLSSLLASLVKPVDASSRRESTIRFIIRKSTPGSGAGAPKHSYQANSKNVFAFVNTACRTFADLNPGSGNTYTSYLDPKRLSNRYEVAELLQVLGLATYEVRGGDNPEIFIRLNDPVKIKNLSNDPRYSNFVLKELNERHEYSAQVITGFFSASMTREERWDLIEEYFLGNDAYVASCLGIDGASAGLSDEGASKKVKFRGKRAIFTGLRARVTSEGNGFAPQPYFRIWKSLAQSDFTGEELADLGRLKNATKGGRYEYPAKNAVLTIESTGAELHPLLAWKERQVLLFRQQAAAEYDLARQTDWTSYLLGQGDTIVKLGEDILTRRRRSEGAD